MPVYDGQKLPVPGDIANGLIEGICKQDAEQVERVVKESTVGNKDINLASLAGMLSDLKERGKSLVEGKVINEVAFTSLPPEHGYIRLLAAKHCWRKYKDGTDRGWLVQVRMYFGEGGAFEGFEAREDEIKPATIIPNKDKGTSI